MKRPFDTLDYDVQQLAARLLFKCAEQGIQLRVISGLRTFAQQEALYASGRTAPGQIVTHAKPGQSWHNWSRAFDVCIEKWPGDQTPKDVFDGPWDTVGQLGESLGLTWGGRFHHPDRPHFEYPAGRTLAAMLAQHPRGLA